ncbi:MAG TPA: RagB/SusD family nutrient uptake outer membrane protein [Sphingobacteriaceae bacterium]
MKSKNIFKLLAITSLLFFSSACKESFLDEVPHKASIVESQYFTTVDQCNTSTMVAYAFIDWTGNNWWQTMNWRHLSGDAASDDAWTGNTYQSTHASYNAVAEYTIDPGNDRNEGHWIMLYKGIGIFNSTMAGIEKAPIDENSKKQFIAELKFLRSWCYFDLVRNWGGVPLVLKINSPSEHVPRSTASEVYTQIINDLKEAAAVLPKKSQYASKDKYRASRGAALTLLAKAYLYTEDWANAETAAKQVMDLGDYSLEPFFGTLWNYNYKNGSESIFEIQFSSVQVPLLPDNKYNKVMNSPADGGWAYYSITSDLENAYKAEADSVRLQWTINRTGMPVVGDPGKPVYDGRPANGLPGKAVQSKSGRYSRKHYTPMAQRPSNGLYAFNDKILRFADVVLMHAEACAMQNKTGLSLGSLKKIRDRVNLPTNMTLTDWNLINAVRKERRLEMAMEGDRLYDLRRWKDQSGKPVIQSILGPNGSFVKYNTQISTDKYETANLIEPQNKGTNFDPAVHMVWPIPNSQIVSSEGVIKQNPGYF